MGNISDLKDDFDRYLKGHSGKKELRIGAGPFVTKVARKLKSGRVWVITSRRDRKGRGPRYEDSQGRVLQKSGKNPWLHLWAPNRLSWWVAVLFVAGSFNFTMGPVFSMTGKGMQGQGLAWFYFIGSCFFTSASYLQYLEALNAPLGPDFFINARTPKRKKEWQWFGFKAEHAAFWATFPQFVGTLFFNLNCASGLFPGQATGAVWVDQWGSAVLGSILFLTSAWFGILESEHTPFTFKPHSISWWIVWVNFLGCAGFLAGSAMALPQGGTPVLFCIDNMFNFQGGLFFLISSYLMIPELFSR